MQNENIIKWLLKGDVSIQYQVYKDLLGEERKDLRDRIATEGWGAEFLAKRNDNGHWGQKFYQPKWTSTHYTLLDLKNLCISPANEIIQESVELIADTEKGIDGGINPSPNIPFSDLCINGMFLNYASYFLLDETKLESIIDCILLQKMADGGFNCRFNRFGARHGSMHTTISVLEGIAEYRLNGYQYRLEELKESELSAREFLLMHQLYLSDRTGKVINPDFLRLSFPGRWRYDILRALDYFQYSQTPWDCRMQPAIDLLLKKRRKDNRWRLQAKHPGRVHFEMEKAGRPSRWNTLRAMRVLQHYGIGAKKEEQVLYFK
ncbi:hypothetical protein [Poritiphilus flavus]|uniref:Uncharacterized protein n=1 Tax=Poritiphilus flavus TaxID=2697053 RepID=A0A6L9ECA2_9FLAO|nr:hypothetical protein [Poritiphilus flavus]NAS12273.1 hypothetical protein [Poritiphilus flavus]